MAAKVHGELEVVKGLGLPYFTTAERLAYTPPRDGYHVYDNDEEKVYYYSEGIWVEVPKDVEWKFFDNTHPTYNVPPTPDMMHFNVATTPVTYTIDNVNLPRGARIVIASHRLGGDITVGLTDSAMIEDGQTSSPTITVTGGESVTLQKVIGTTMFVTSRYSG